MLYAAIIGTIAVDVTSMVIIRRSRRRLTASRLLRRWRWLLWAIGGALAVSAVTITWPYDAETKILGFPFPAAAFELWTNDSGESFWADFVGPLTLPFLVLDFVLCLYVPQFVLALILLTGKDEKSAI